MFKNLWFQAHWLIGITAGIVLAIVGFTGGILSFESEIQQWLNRDVRAVAPQDSAPLTPDLLIARLAAAHPDKQVTALALSADPAASARVTFAPPASAAGAEGRPPGRGGPRGETRYVNPYTGELIEGEANRGQGFFRTTRSLHRWLVAGEFGDQQIGRHIVGASTVLCIVLALSGLYLRWPRRALDWRSWLTFDWALKGRSFLWHLHSIVGTWVLVGFLLMSFTGLYWSYDWYRSGLFAIAGVERPAPRGAGPQGVREGTNRPEAPAPAAPATDLQIVWTAFAAATRDHGYTTANLTLPREPGRPVEIRYIDADPAHERANNTLTLDGATGAVLRHERYDDKRTGEKFMASIFPLHSGSFFGTPGLVLYMIASFAMPLFAITGWLLYLDRRKKKKAARAAESAAAPLRPLLPVAAGPGESLLLAFASQAGFARQLAWQTAGSLQAAGFNVDVQPLEKLKQEHFSRSKHALFVVSTFGEGEPPDDARSFMRRVMAHPLPLGNLKYGLLALGDRQYKTFCEFGHSLEQWLRRQGAEPLFPIVEVDNGDPRALDDWRNRLGKLAGDAQLAPWQEQPYHKWRLGGRRLLNPGSAGGPTYHIELVPLDGALPDWSAGDIAEIRLADLPQAPKREFSIASIPADGSLQLVIRQVQRPDGTLGLGSGWLTAQAEVGAEVQLRIRSNPGFHRPMDDRPLLLIGNGTGIAGLRSLLRERASLGQRRNWLVFGERNQATDFYYRDEIGQWQRDGVLERVDLAFSRDQAERIYVQRLLRKHAATLRSWLADGAAVYVCGSLEGMAPGVDTALVEIIGTGALERLAEAGRYRRDVY